ncbi:hypothetical protein FisN_32Hh072 [Fistulifera solaris]|uniref:Uncharacterized protein n=1 Tax=Fistulifera solaris TaxID=1519565 RepID=A0A1Z5K351_FISSO|nr:hypothetical protein FisN_32Hh072 [Fistulifera solaris]|eukprot:GAX20683.1 hypothetical protein FisN_32Hh072 [Fistulifera solaris]
MVRVWYEPPPYGPGTDLNRSPYGTHGGGLFGKATLEKISRMRQGPLMAGGVLFSLVLCYLPVANQKLPFTMDPEYQAATRAYMRYHNMNPIFGISSQRQRNIDG